MTLSHNILGLLNKQALSGYDLKKLIQECCFMPWSGNSNQIYKTLVQLNDNGWVEAEVLHQDGVPSKKLYTITEEGKNELKNWTETTLPEMPEIKKNFLMQLAWVSESDTKTLNNLLLKYEEEIRIQLLSHQEEKNRAILSLKRSEQEKFIWEMIYDNFISTYENELQWTIKMRKEMMKKMEDSHNDH